MNHQYSYRIGWYEHKEFIENPKEPKIGIFYLLFLALLLGNLKSLFCKNENKSWMA
jgi:hypothetical protein